MATDNNYRRQKHHSILFTFLQLPKLSANHHTKKRYWQYWLISIYLVTFLPLKQQHQIETIHVIEENWIFTALYTIKINRVMLVNLLVGVLALGLVRNGKKNSFSNRYVETETIYFILVNSLECITCSSASLNACSTLTSSLPSTTCAEGVDRCYTFVQGVCVLLKAFNF